MLPLLIAIAVVTFLLVRFYSQVRSLPPGPFPLPLIGNVHQLTLGIMRHKEISVVLRKWQEKHGNVFTLWLGPTPVVSICDYENAHDAMLTKGSSFALRPKIFLMDVLKDGRGIANSNGDHWTEQRRFALTTLRNFGLGRNLMQDRIMLEFDYRKSILDKQIDDNGGCVSFDPYAFIELTLGNIVNRILFSERLNQKREEEFMSMLKVANETAESSNLIDYILTERNAEWPIFKQRMDYLKRPAAAMKTFVESNVQWRFKDIADGNHELVGDGEDFVDAYLIHMQKEAPGESFNEGTLVVTLMDLLAGGLESTTATLHWCFAYLTLFPKEIFRVSNLFPMNVVRETAEDTVVGGYLIPRGIQITVQISMIMSDPKNIDKPEEFKPERFLVHEDLAKFVIVFGLGKRACPAEAMARAELYMLIGNMMLQYNVLADPEHPAEMEAISESGLMRKPKSFNIMISKRG